MDHSKMKTEDYLNYLKNEIHSTVFATVDENGNPVTRVIDIMLVKETKLYFLTAISKPFYKQLKMNPVVSITGIEGETSMESFSITLQGRVNEIGSTYLDEIFEKNPYMAKIYPLCRRPKCFTSL
ncbi:hypothetical protein YS9_2047 [Enterococcus sp. C1]|uniref:pyridoxamine 5'-phosphate oxidase family protein n=1 Tax=unclassified Enterococcus TaxID=2608891 RepID=UPI00027209F7|nr:pyridoxamine 5'-phosphate oxidase family protein [Enterococcus sp. C1]EJF49490.1 hypothetical protein YS9_2047 [Enterococcus sp. C1]